MQRVIKTSCWATSHLWNDRIKPTKGGLRDFEVYIHNFIVSVRRKVNRAENFPESRFSGTTDRCLIVDE